MEGVKARHGNQEGDPVLIASDAHVLRNLATSIRRSLNDARAHPPNTAYGAGAVANDEVLRRLEDSERRLSEMEGQIQHYASRNRELEDVSSFLSLLLVAAA